MTKDQMIQSIITDLQNGSADVQTDNQGQIVIYTSLFRQADTQDEGSFTYAEEYPDPNWED